MKRLYKQVKSGKVTEEIADEMADMMDTIENMGSEAKEKFADMMDDMKKSISKMKK
ncbi:hypothetical protein [Clostridium chauvoei]|nr:hypothetical protein [Clostridium chauvoei]